MRSSPEPSIAEDCVSMSGFIFDIQNYAIYDGPGIRTCVYFKGCPLRCWWCHNPESHKLKPEMGYWEDRCVLCGACVDACPNDALVLETDRVSRNRDLCTVCETCARVCPNEAMEKIGYEITTDEITEKVIRDKVFYETSGGGVTITGGEPTFQKEFLFKVLESLRDAGIHTAIETCGYFSEDLIGPLVEKVDIFLYDLKHIDASKHREATGAGNEKILNNFAKILTEVGTERIIPRIPLIPGFNTDSASISDIISYLKSVKYDGSVHLLPYHTWARGKYKKIGRGDSFRDPGKITEEKLEKINRVFSEAGFMPLQHG